MGCGSTGSIYNWWINNLIYKALVKYAWLNRLFNPLPHREAGFLLVYLHTYGCYLPVIIKWAYLPQQLYRERMFNGCTHYLTFVILSANMSTYVLCIGEALLWWKGLISNNRLRRAGRQSENRNYFFLFSKPNSSASTVSDSWNAFLFDWRDSIINLDNLIHCLNLIKSFVCNALNNIKGCNIMKGFQMQWRF